VNGRGVDLQAAVKKPGGRKGLTLTLKMVAAIAAAVGRECPA
jgi:hypothetical protein